MMPRKEIDIKSKNQDTCTHKFTILAFAIVCEYCGYKWNKVE